MDNTTIIATVAGIILAAILVFSLLKGFIRMLLLAVAVIAAAGLWILMQKHGDTFLSFIMDSPQPWMVQVLSWGSALFCLMVGFHAMRWFSQVFSFRKHGGPTGVITTILMCCVMLWVMVVGLSYYGDVCRIAYYHDLGLAQMNGTPLPEKPWSTAMKDAIRTSSLTAWLEYIDPMENPAQTNLACLVAFGCALDEPTCEAFFYNQLDNRGIPHAFRLLDLFRDPGLRTIVSEGRYVTLLENERLTTFLQFKNTEELMRNIL